MSISAQHPIAPPLDLQLLRALETRPCPRAEAGRWASWANTPTPPSSADQVRVFPQLHPAAMSTSDNRLSFPAQIFSLSVDSHDFSPGMSQGHHKHVCPKLYLSVFLVCLFVYLPSSWSTAVFCPLCLCTGYLVAQTRSQEGSPCPFFTLV